MDEKTFKTYYIPDYLKKYFDYEKIEHIKNGKKIIFEYAVFKDSFFEKGFSEFEEKALLTLKNAGIDDIINNLDEVSARVLSSDFKELKETVEIISLMTGLTIKSVKQSIELEFLSSRAPEMKAALKNEFFDYKAMDGFKYNENLKGRVRIIPDSPIFGICSSNIPALPHLSIMRSFMTKNCIILKTSSGEPLFTPLYMSIFEEINSPLKDCALVVCYKSDFTGLTEKLIERSNIVIAYGGVAAEKFLASKVLWPKKLIMHAHKLGFGIIGDGMYESKNSKDSKKLIEAVVFDTVTFEQRACLAPHVYFYNEKHNAPVDEFIDELLSGLEKMELKFPLPALSAEEIFSRRNFIDSLYFSMENVQILETVSKKSAVICARASEFPVSCLNRTLFVVPYKDENEILNIITPLKKYLQNVSLNVSFSEENFWLEKFGVLGVSRICRAGKMPVPTMMWHHDGRCCLGELVKYCDYEENL